MARYILIVGNQSDRSNFFKHLLESLRSSQSNQSVAIEFNSQVDNNETTFSIKEEDGNVYVAKGADPVFYIREFTPTSPEKRQYAAGVIQIITSMSGEKLADHLQEAELLSKQYQIETEIFDASEGNPIDAIMQLVQVIEQAKAAQEAQQKREAEMKQQRTSILGMFAKPRVVANLLTQFEQVAQTEKSRLN